MSSGKPRLNICIKPRLRGDLSRKRASRAFPRSLAQRSAKKFQKTCLPSIVLYRRADDCSRTLCEEAKHGTASRPRFDEIRPAGGHAEKTKSARLLTGPQVQES
jgi:hypothetical protein